MNGGGLRTSDFNGIFSLMNNYYSGHNRWTKGKIGGNPWVRLRRFNGTLK